jgi:hypothetical protein
MWPQSTHRSAVKAAREKAERGKTSPLSPDRLASLFGGKDTDPASEKTKQAEAAQRLRDELQRQRDRKPGFDRE